MQQAQSARTGQVNRRSERRRAISSGEDASQPLRLSSTRSKASIRLLKNYLPKHLILLAFMS
jgi:hypothetical protein